MEIPSVRELFPDSKLSELSGVWSPGGVLLHNAFNKPGTPDFSPVEQKIVAAAFRTCVDKGDMVVEIGAGIGRLGSLVPGDYRQSYVQTELHPQSSRWTRMSNYDMPVATADALHLPFRPESLGAVMGMDVVDMVDINRVAAQIANTLRPNGVFLHFHDRRTSVRWAGDVLLGDGHYVFPYVDDKGWFERFQTISVADFDEHFPEPDRELRAMANPRVVEIVNLQLDESMPKDAINKASERVHATGTTRLSKNFRELMTISTAEAFEAVGMELGVSEVALAGAFLPTTDPEMGMLYRNPDGGIYQIPRGRMHELNLREPEPGTTHMYGSLHVMMAAKP